jgi:hypothetical protein
MAAFWIDLGTQVRNPNIEIRNKFKIRNSKPSNETIHGAHPGVKTAAHNSVLCLRHFLIWDLEFVSIFVLRISNLFQELNCRLGELSNLRFEI